MNKNSIKSKDYTFIAGIVCVLKILPLVSFFVENYYLISVISVVLSLMPIVFVVYMFVKNRYSFIKNWELPLLAVTFCITPIYQLIMKPLISHPDLIYSYQDLLSTALVYGPLIRVCEYGLFMLVSSVAMFKNYRLRKENS